ncbi:ATPase inhibitor subunit zeta [Shinella sp. 838]|jgi:hypothetical protein|uniref:DUF1476 domain-containing protein n=1 Tax=unclassified Shinella TaxID=2643062 RepID=UPI0003C5521E|nr:MULTISPECIES: ATPase inhibitor subunit zeta [unclassified Shinella]EYR80092.1 hypothetical protein SHLA_56c000080 [Shinella sp. DD12]MCA0338103.1 DUF1476 domain-containing protein [Pseudomonadota bacterium]MDG4670995.1 ATPase inhibitor subunit zeta [Shinella sp. 838]
MSALKKRARALEDEFAYQQEFMFKANARRNALLGLWAANTMHRPDGEAYARELAMADVGAADGAFNRVRADLRSAGVNCPDDELRDRMVVMLKDVARDMRGY